MEPAAARRLFPVTDRYAYLNHASLGPPSVPVLAGVEGYLQDLHHHGMVNQADRDEWLAGTRRQAAHLIGAQPAEVAFTRNTSHGLLLIANATPWREGDNVVIAETEFSANVYPWLSLKWLGVETRFAASREGRIAVEDVARLIDSRTRLVALSFVEYWTGYRNDLVACGELCRARHVRFCVDAVQGLGALPVDVDTCQIDYLSAGGYKWLLSPTGTGILYCRKGLIEDLRPITVSWRSVMPGTYPDYAEPIWPDARRFEEGDLNWPGLHGLAAALELILAVGPSRIEQRIRELTDHLIDGLYRQGYRIVSPVQSWMERSGIVTFGHDRHDLADLHRRLREAGVIVESQYTPGITSNYPYGIRVACHFINNEEDIDRLLEALP